MGKPSEYMIALLRAGATDWEQAGRLVGSADLPLSVAGLEEVRSGVGVIAGEISGPGLAAIIAGPSESCQASAEVLGTACGGKIKRYKELADPGLGLWEGVLGTDLEERCPTTYRQWLEDPSSVRAPEGEALADAEHRVVTQLSKALDKIKGEGRVPVGVVVRPVAWALVRCWLDGRAFGDVWKVLDEADGAAHVQVIGRDHLRNVKAGLRVSA